MSLTQTVTRLLSRGTDVQPADAPVVDRKQLQHQLFDDLCAAGYAPHKIKILFGLFAELAKAVEEQDSYYYDADAGAYVVPMDMSAHHVLDGFMKDKTLPAAGSLHAQANRAFLPDSHTFLHDRYQACVLEARLN